MIGRFINADGYASTGQGLQGSNMFAYCGNNPINRADSSGQMWLKIIAITITVVAYLVEYDRIVAANYEHNSAVDSNPATSTKNRILNDQNGATGDNFVYGNYDASHNACEAIAIHNAKVLMGIDSTLSETIRDCQEAGSMLLYGALGTNPWDIGKILNSIGIDATQVGLDEMTMPGIYVISYWHSAGAHTVAIQFDGNVYTTYNRYGNGDVYYADPASFASNYIDGYYLGVCK